MGQNSKAGSYDSEPSLIRPFLKWPGGKFRLIAALQKILPPGECLVEPFVGAGSVFLNLDYPHYQLNDINKDLIKLYETIQKGARRFIEESKLYFPQHYNQKETYYQLRTCFNQSRDPYQRALLFLYLNRHGYNGLCRYNQKGGYNVPFGDYRAPYFPEVELCHYAQRSKQVTLLHQDFKEVMMNAPRHSVVYCDPPYLPLSKTAQFTSYAGNHFGWEEHELLAKYARQLRKRGVVVVISNHDLPVIRQLYRGAKLFSIAVSRTMSCQAHTRQKVEELIAIF